MNVAGDDRIQSNRSSALVDARDRGSVTGGILRRLERIRTAGGFRWQGSEVVRWSYS